MNDSEFGKEMFENFVEICRNNAMAKIRLKHEYKSSVR